MEGDIYISEKGMDAEKAADSPLGDMHLKGGADACILAAFKALINYPVPKEDKVCINYPYAVTHLHIKGRGYPAVIKENSVDACVVSHSPSVHIPEKRCVVGRYCLGPYGYILVKAPADIYFRRLPVKGYGLGDKALGVVKHEYERYHIAAAFRLCVVDMQHISVHQPVWGIRINSAAVIICTVHAFGVHIKAPLLVTDKFSVRA